VSGSELDLAAILRSLNEHEVDYVVIGAVAVAGHGYVRGTTDLDVVPEPATPNLERLAAALAELEARPWLPPGFPAETAPRELDVGLLETGRNFALLTRFGELDVMQDVPGAPAYDELRAEALEAPLVSGLVVRICSYEHLAAMKRASGRAQDALDLDELNRILGEGPEDPG
jgi:predicted nucleotidyltransferase